MQDPQDETIAQALHRRLTEARARNASPQEINQEIAWAKEALDEASAADPERQPTTADKLGAAAQTFADAATLGVSGIADDAVSSALSGGQGSPLARFQAARDARKASLSQFRGSNPKTALALEVAGSLSSPANRFLGPLKQGAGFFKTVLKSAGEGAIQAGAQATGENLGTTDDPTGLKHGGKAAVLGGGAGGTLGVASRVVPIAATAVRAFKTPNLGKTATALDDAITKSDAFRYAVPEGEGLAAGGTDATLEHYLMNDPDIAKYVKLVRNSKGFRNADDATVAREAYKLLSEVEGKLGSQMEGSPRFLAKAAMASKDIPAIKNDLVNAAKNVMPSWNWAIGGHAAMKAQEGVFQRGADMANVIMMGTDIAGKKLLKNSPAVWEREIAKMTPDEAEWALKGVMGRIKEIPEFTSNPVGQFGVKSSLAKTFLGPSRIQKYVTMLEKRAGMAPRSTMMQDQAPRLGRVVGAVAGNDDTP